MSSPVRIWLAMTAAIVAAHLATACNDTKTVHRTIPPIAGVTVGGPDAQGGTGQVGVAVNEVQAGTVVGSTLYVSNLTRHVANSVTITAPLGQRIIPVQGDVGDMIEVTLTSEGVGEGSHTYDVPSVAITNVASQAGAINAVRVGQNATINGSGFCFVEGQLATNRVFIDGTATEPVIHVTGDGLTFAVPMTLSTSATHTLQVTVGGGVPANPIYTSNTLNFTATHL